ncbi:MAG: hypothetical protein PHN82_00045 [bacterium]|nr:hypothetical protein [bacterium]
MHPLELVKEALAQKSRRKFDEKMDEFVWALIHTREGRKLRERKGIKF